MKRIVTVFAVACAACAAYAEEAEEKAEGAQEESAEVLPAAAGIQNMLVAISGMMVQSFVNSTNNSRN